MLLGYINENLKQILPSLKLITDDIMKIHELCFQLLQNMKLKHFLV